MTAAGGLFQERLGGDKSMRWLRPGEFYVVYLTDHDAKTFNVIGPIFEGDNIDDRTYTLRQQGRNLQIGVGPPQDDPLGFHPENYNHCGPEGYRYDPHLRW